MYNYRMHGFTYEFPPENDFYCKSEIQSEPCSPTSLQSYWAYWIKNVPCVMMLTNWWAISLSCECVSFLNIIRNWLKWLNLAFNYCLYCKLWPRFAAHSIAFDSWVTHCSSAVVQKMQWVNIDSFLNVVCARKCTVYRSKSLLWI